MSYDLEKDGVVLKIRITVADNLLTPIAELKLASGKIVVIRWDCVEHRNIYMKGINAYTLWYDERRKAAF